MRSLPIAMPPQKIKLLDLSIGTSLYMMLLTAIATPSLVLGIARSASASVHWSETSFVWAIAGWKVAAATKQKEKPVSLMLSQLMEIVQRTKSDTDPSVLLQLALRYKKVGEEKQAAKLFSQAVNSFAEMIEYAKSKRGTIDNSEELQFVANILAEVGEVAPVFELVEKVRDDNYKYAKEMVLKGIAGSFFSLGKFTKGFEIIQKIKINDYKTQALQEFLSSPAIVEQSAAALKIAETLNAENKSAIVAEVAVSYAASGRGQQAAEILAQAVDQLTVSNARSVLALETIAIAYAQIGQIEKATVLVEKIQKNYQYQSEPALSAIALSYAKTGQYDLAMNIVQTIQVSIKEKFNILKDIAIQTAMNGQYDRAVEIAKKIDFTDGFSQRIEALTEIAIQAAKGKQPQKALTIARLVDDNYNSSALQAIALSYAQIGQVDQGIEIAQNIQSKYDQPKAISAIALHVAELREYDRAIEIAQKIEDEFRKDDALEAIVNQAIELKQYKSALKIAPQVKYRQVYILTKIAISYAEDRRQEEALGIVEAIEDRESKDRILNAIAVSYAQAGKYDQALKTTEAIAGSINYKTDALARISAICADAGETKLASEIFTKVLQIAETLKDSDQKDAALGSLIHSYAQAGDKAKANFSFSQALLVLKNMNNPDWGLGKVISMFLPLDQF